MVDINLCFLSHAGGSARSYASFKKYLPSEINVCPLEIAGRGSRLSERCYTDAAECAGDVFRNNKEIFEAGNYAFFGHSLGAIISFELAKIIKRCHLPSPEHIFFSGRPAPHSKKTSAISGASEQSDEDFIKMFSLYGALPDVLTRNKEMLDIFLPILKSDVKMADNYKIDNPHHELDCDISVLFGNNDLVYSGQDLDLWSECTSGRCSSIGFEGDHFYFNNPEIKLKVCEYISQVLIK